MKKRVLLVLLLVAALLPATFSVALAEDEPHVHCVCGGTECSGKDHDPTVKWTEWTSETTLPDTAGYYYLANDVTLENVWGAPNNTYLCLNGKTIVKQGAAAIYVAAGTNFSLTDCSGNEGKVTSNGTSVGTDSGAVYNQGTFRFYAGNITNTSSVNNGGGVKNLATMYMYGGIISNCTATGTYSRGGGISNLGGTLYLSGGEITNCSSSRGWGGGICSWNGTVRMTGGSIHGNPGSGIYCGNLFLLGGTITANGTGVTARNADGWTCSVTLGGDIKLKGNNGSNLYLWGAVSTVSADTPFTSEASVGVTSTAGNPASVTGTNSKDLSGFFTSDDANRDVVNVNNVVKLDKKTHEHVWAYTAKDDTLYAYCTADTSCPFYGTESDLSKAKTAVLTTQEEEPVYDGKKQGVLFLNVSGQKVTTLEGLTLDESEISYEGTGETEYGPSTEKPVDAGTYKATYTVSVPGGGSVTATKEFTVEKSTVTIDEIELGYEQQPDGTFEANVVRIKLGGIAKKDMPYSAYTTSAVMLDDGGNETTDPSKAKSVRVTLTLDETAEVNKNYRVSESSTFPLDISDVEKIKLTVTISPSDVTVREGKTATFTANANYNQSVKKLTSLDGNEITYTYQWYVDKNAGKGPEAIKGATRRTYTTSAVTLKNDGYLYYCNVTDSYGRETMSDPAALHVQPDVPTTGDENRPLLFAGLLLLAGAGLAVLKKRTAK